ncbi:hypothetical protein [Nibricoccus sp. IMCC34717]|uniref:hypothetical protein n=1 Tax=Nibricoccus sp. IMCC34717 TaxID=3034021 RepID=UPI00384D7D5B
MANRTLQDWVRWMDAGRGARLAVRAAAVLGVVLLTFTICYRQFHGARDETTLAQLSAARGWAAGQGHSTQALHPQALAVLEARGTPAAGAEWIPELYQPPGYAFVTGGVLRLLPESWRVKVLSTVLPPPDGFAADYLVLGLNAVALLLAALACRALASRVLSPRAGNVAFWILLVSTGLWQSAVALSGVGLSCLLVVSCLACAWGLCLGDEHPRRAGWLALGLGATLGLLVLVDYFWLAALPVIAAWAWLGAAEQRKPTWGVCVLVAALLPVAGWFLRGEQVSGQAFGLAGQDVFLREGDSSAEPSTVRATWTIETPPMHWAKVGNKLLTHVREVSLSGLWRTSFLASALALVGLAYAYREPRLRRLRAFAVLLLIAGVIGEGVWGTGNALRPAMAAGAPLLALFGASFLLVLIESRAGWSAHATAVVVAFALVQALPLTHDLLEPRRIHFSYPPYYPVLLQKLGDEVAARGGGKWSWMSDLPAGSAWYAGRPVIGKGATARDYREVAGRRPILCLLLSPETLDKPFFSDLLRAEPESPGRTWRWSDVYRGLALGRMPPGFPLTQVEKLAPNLIVLADPGSPAGGR